MEESSLRSNSGSSTLIIQHWKSWHIFLFTIQPVVEAAMGPAQMGRLRDTEGSVGLLSYILYEQVGDTVEEDQVMVEIQ